MQKFSNLRSTMSIVSKNFIYKMKLSILLFLPLISYGSAINGCFNVPKEEDPNSVVNQRIEANYTRGPNKWQPLLVSSAETAALLTHMVALSSQVPISLNDHTRPEGWTWKHVRFPDSLSATVAQLANEIWNTINKATGNMAEVEQWMKLIPSNIRGSLRIVRRVPLEVIPKLLPAYLNQIEEAGTKAAILANNTVIAFEKVMLFLEEVQGGILSTRTAKKESLRLAKIEFNQTMIRKKQAEKAQADLEKRYKMLQGRVKNAISDFHKQLKKVPSSWQRTLQKLVVGLVGCINSAMNSFNPNSWFSGSKGSSDGSGSSGRPTAQGKDESKTSVEDQARITHDKFMLKDLDLITRDIDPLVHSITSSCESRAAVKQAAQELSHITNFTITHWTKNRYSKTKLREKSEDLLNTLVTLCNQISSILADEMLLSEPQNITCMVSDSRDSIVKQLESVRRELQTLSLVNANAFNGENSAENGQSGGNGNYGLNDVQFAIAEARMILENLLEKEENSHAQLMETMEQLGNLNAELAGLDLRKMNLDEIIKVLTKIGKSLAVLVDIWKKQLQFFTEVKSNAAILKSMSDMYAELGRTQMTEASAYAAGRHVLMDSLIRQAKKVQEKSYLVYSMAKIYVRVSRSHLLEPLSKVNRMFFETSIGGVTALRDELVGKIEETKIAITELMEQEDQTFREKTALQKQRYDKLLDNCGGLPQYFTQINQEANQLSNQLGQLSDEESDATEDFD